MKTHPGMRLAASSLAVLFLTLAGTAKADVCGSIAGNVVANCGFETGDFSGWTLSGNLQGGAPPNFYYGVDNTNPNSGSYAAYFAVQGGGGTAIGTFGPFLALSQTLHLLPAEYYQVSFYFAQDTPPTPGYLNYIDLRFGGALRAYGIDVPQTGGYVPETFVVSTSGDPLVAASTLLQFDFQNDAGYFDFDDVSVVPIGAVPEPASLGLLLAASAVLLLGKRRSRVRP
ncbi:MAG TPA: PEP-CTERM sorting domain-containing protein [Bryobacteraceae bacterium]|jgi:hypothetical protein|nr:PEP-CTERM sorting domain-containing protein [Bryobacteraceae bacterium]